MNTTPHPLLPLLVQAGLSDRRIAEHYGVSPRTVLRWRIAERLATRWVSPRETEHGTIAMYQSWGCRCDACRAANVAANLRGRESRKARLVDGVAPVDVHDAQTYANWGCRCEKCRAANASRSAANRERARSKADASR